jgi:hypothetical protein
MSSLAKHTTNNFYFFPIERYQCIYTKQSVPQVTAYCFLTKAFQMGLV